MKLTHEVEAAGLRAYEQVRAFERLRAWRLPMSYVFFSMIPLTTGFALLKGGHPVLGELHLTTALFFVAGSCFHWRWLVRRYTNNLKLLAQQEQLYGDQLPWVQVEKHLAALDRLKRDLEQEKIAEALKGVKEKLDREPDEPPSP
jgi:hypothetical protein